MEIAPRMGGDLAMGGLIALGQGSLLTSMLWSAALAFIVQRRFLPAAGWVAAAAAFSTVGIIHAYRLTPNAVESLIGWWAAPQFTLGHAVGRRSCWPVPGTRKGKETATERNGWLALC
jgi:AGZA family xanthine/uracil permease-like MFS transporter